MQNWVFIYNCPISNLDKEVCTTEPYYTNRSLYECYQFVNLYLDRKEDP